MWGMIRGKERGINTYEGERNVCCKEERKAFRKVVIQPVAAIEDGKRLGDVEVEKAEGWEGEESVI